jgi:hypothetical protein
MSAKQASKIWGALGSELEPLGYVKETSYGSDP